MPFSRFPFPARATRLGHGLVPLAGWSFATAMLAAPVAADPPAIVTAQVLIRERITIRRVPRMPMAAPTLARPVPMVRGWRERKGPKCVPVDRLAGASIVAPMAIDLLTVDGRRLRARLDHDCSSMDYYSGLYIRPGEDGQVCARRDSIRVRSGARCGIAVFRALEPVR